MKEFVPLWDAENLQSTCYGACTATVHACNNEQPFALMEFNRNQILFNRQDGNAIVKPWGPNLFILVPILDLPIGSKPILGGKFPDRFI